MKKLNFLIINNLMKFKKFLISLVILVCLLKISTCQLFEQFNDELSALEKKSKSLFDEPEEDLKPINSIFGSNNAEKPSNNNAVPSIFGSVGDDLAKPIEVPKQQQIKKQTANDKVQNNAGPIKNLAIQVKKTANENTKPINSGINFLIFNLLQLLIRLRCRNKKMKFRSEKKN